MNRLGDLRKQLLEMRPGRRSLLLMVAGAAAATGFPPLHLVFFLVPAFVLLFWSIDGSRHLPGAFRAGWLFGVGHFAVAFYWVGQAFLVDLARYGWMAPFAVAGLASGLALFPALVALISKAVFQRTALAVPARVLLFAMIWIAVEWVRGWLLTGFPWNLLGSVWAWSDAMMQFASVGGVLGLGLLTLIAATLPAVLGFDVTARPGIAWSTGGIALLIGVAGFGLWRLASPPVGYVDGVVLRLVQPNIAQHLKWQNDLRMGHVRSLVSLSLQQPGPGNPAPTHLIWPETAVPFNLQHDRNLLAGLGDIIPSSGYLLTGAPRSDAPTSATPHYWNSLIAVAPGGTIAGIYDKIHLVPFGEYVPWRSVLDITKLTEGRSDFSFGDRPRTMDLPGLPVFAPLICYEIIFPGEVRSLGRTPGWLLNITNDAWFGTSSGPYQHLAIARFRAVELGLPVVRVANTGISALIGPFGRVIDRLELGQAGILDVGLPRALAAPTLYARFGDAVVLLLMLIGTSLLFLLRK